MAEASLVLEIQLVPDEKTMGAILKLLDLWQEANPDRQVAMVPQHNEYVYEIISRKIVPPMACHDCRDCRPGPGECIYSTERKL